ncbi:MAG: hypothetical protein JWQ04_1856 [Pedosphaera sp.]|nr:hypothetical protein [Pedosphaera sp.]
MVRQFKSYFAIKSYALRLPGELARRFDIKEFYTVEQVTKAAQKGGFNVAFIAYAHATFCSRADFDAHYGPLKVACTYEGLRSVVGRRYFRRFGGVFDASTIIQATKSIDGAFSESGLGDDAGGH